MTDKLDFEFTSPMQPQKGNLLIADPFASDKYFTRSVVLLCDHNDEGSFGFVLNNYLEIDLPSLIKGFPEIKSKVSIGGPVDTQSIFYIHNLGERIKGSVAIVDGVYFGGEFEQIKELIIQGEIGTNQVRFFLGYAGWSKEQLIDEINENAWIAESKFNLPDILDTSKDDLWKKLMQKKGGKFKLMTEFPLNPTNN